MNRQNNENGQHTKQTHVFVRPGAALCISIGPGVLAPKYSTGTAIQKLYFDDKIGKSQIPGARAHAVPVRTHRGLCGVWQAGAFLLGADDAGLLLHKM